MNSRGLTKENLVATLPVALQKDKSAVALAEAVAAALSERPEEIDRIRIYPEIDRLDDQLLDILAHDFKVDWWDPDYGVTVKRRMLKSSWRVHKTLGTKAATDRAVAAVYPDSTVLEWFKYGGEPHHFKVTVRNDGTLNSMQGIEKFYRLVWIVKRLSSWLDDITITTDLGERPLRMGGVMAVITRIPIPEMADTFNFEGAVHTGGLAAAIHRIPVPEQADVFKFEHTARVGGRAATTVHSIPIPEDTSTTLSFTGRVGVRGSVSITIPLPEIP